MYNIDFQHVSIHLFLPLSVPHITFYPLPCRRSCLYHPPNFFTTSSILTHRRPKYAKSFTCLMIFNQDLHVVQPPVHLPTLLQSFPDSFCGQVFKVLLHSCNITTCLRSQQYVFYLFSIWLYMIIVVSISIRNTQRISQEEKAVHSSFP